jgi:hypothetical protein
MELSKELKELLKERDREYRERHPLTSDERHKEILEASNNVTLDDYDPNSQWSFREGESPFSWYDAQVRAINHFGHIFCINPYYDNGSDNYYGKEFDSTEKLLDAFNLSEAWEGYLDMTIRTIQYLRSNCGVEFPNGWGNQFPVTQ